MPKINVKGVIVSNDDKWIYEYFDMAATSPADISQALEQANGEPVEVEINSTGGDVWAGSEIYTALKSYGGGVTTKIVGIAASAASIIAMAGNPAMISPTAEIMIHNVSMGAGGDYRDHQHAAQMLQDYNSTIANAYMLKSGMAKERLLELMNAETWLTPQQALEMGFVDEIMFANTSPVRLAASASGLLPQEVINKVRDALQNRAHFDLQKTQLMQNQLKLKGAKK